jgi:hypothetical protein
MDQCAWISARGSVLVPVAVVLRVPASVVDVVDVVTVRDGHVAASVTVLMGVGLVLGMALGLALVDVVVVNPVQVAVVNVVDVVSVRHGDMTALRPVRVVVSDVLGVVCGVFSLSRHRFLPPLGPGPPWARLFVPCPSERVDERSDLGF